MTTQVQTITSLGKGVRGVQSSQNRKTQVQYNLITKIIMAVCDLCSLNILFRVLKPFTFFLSSELLARVNFRRLVN